MPYLLTFVILTLHVNYGYYGELPMVCKVNYINPLSCRASPYKIKNKVGRTGHIAAQWVN
jgi:hypothetical protein